MSISRSRFTWKGVVQHLETELSQLVDLSLQRLTAHTVGDVRLSSALPVWWYLECTSAGTTGAEAPSLANAQAGALVADGTAVFIVVDGRDGTPVGRVVPSTFVPPGYVLANGATVNRADFPRLVALATAHNLWTASPSVNPGLFGKGDGSTTMVLPNWTGRMAQFAATAGGAVAAGLPNITGTQRLGWSDKTAGVMIVNTNSGTGAFNAPTKVVVTDQKRLADGTSTLNSGHMNTITFNASRSSAVYGASTTVQPPAVNVLPIMRV